MKRKDGFRESSFYGMQNKNRSRQCVQCGPCTMVLPSCCQPKHWGMAWKKKRRLVFIHLLPHSLPSPCCSLWCCLINLPSAPFGFSHPLCGVLPLSSTNKMLITALKAKAGFKEKFLEKGESNGGHFQYQCSVRNKWPERPMMTDNFILKQCSGLIIR